MPDWNHYLQRILELMKRYPGLIAAFGFCSGVGSFILVDRQQGMARWIAVILLVSWVWLMLENTFTQLFSRVFKREIPEPLLRYATQMIHQESFFFVLPFFFITTTWNSGQLVFTGLLGVCALIAITDPLYYKWLAPRRWLFLALHTLALFGVALWSRQAPSGWLNLAGGLFSLGILCFAGGIYVLRIFAGIHTGPLINVVPFGGFCLIGGWLALGVAGWKQR